MNKTRPLNSFFLIAGRDIVKTLLGFFRFTAADACTLLSAYGFHALELDRLQNNRSNELRPSIQFLIAPQPRDEAPCVMKGAIPPSVSVPMHVVYSAELAVRARKDRK
jgi:hypothetical protein